MVADCRAQGPALWIPRAVGAPFMTPVRVHGGGLSGVRFGGVCAVRVFGRHKWRPYVFCGGKGCGGVFIALRCSFGQIPHAVGAPFMTPVRGHGGGLSCARSDVVDSACRRGAIYDAHPRSWWRIVGVRSGGVCAVPVSGCHKWRPYVFAAGWGLRWCLYCVALFRWCLRRSGIRAS